MQIRALSDQRFSAESMQATLSPARQARAHHRHDLGTLTYVVLDDANGGIVRNLSHCGIGVQAVAPLCPQQIVPLRFELRNARLRIEAQGEVVWATASGQCGIRFLDLPPRMVRQINEWIFGSLLESIPQRWGRTDSIFGGVVPSSALVEEDDGLIGRELGLRLSEGATGGGSDGNFTAALGVPTLDGLGVIGDGAHSVDEFIQLDRLPERVALLTRLLTME